MPWRARQRSEQEQAPARRRERLRAWSQAFGQLICLVLRDPVIAYPCLWRPFAAASRHSVGHGTRVSACVVFGSFGSYESAKLFSPLSYLELPSTRMMRSAGFFFSPQAGPGEVGPAGGRPSADHRRAGCGAAISVVGEDDL